MRTFAAKISMLKPDLPSRGFREAMEPPRNPWL